MADFSKDAESQTPSQTIQPPDENSRRFKTFVYILWKPILLLLVQICFLAAAIFFLIWSSTGNHPVPRALNDLYSRHPQSSTAVLTLFGTILGWITTKLFAYAIWLAINVSLRKETGFPLYKISVATTVASNSLLLDWDKGRNWDWMIISVFYFLLFLVQTSAWTTIITPKQGLIHSTGNFSDFDLTTPVLANGSLTISYPFTAFWQSSASGLAAVRDIAAAAGAIDISAGPPTDTTRNISRLLPYSDFALNGTSSGILPQIPDPAYDGGWVKINTVQQGLTSNVTCMATSAADTPQLIIDDNYLNGTQYIAASLRCNDSTSETGSTVVNANVSSYGFFTICPYKAQESPADNITLYMIIGGAGFFNHSNFLFSCNIQPQLLNVSVTYNSTGIVSIERLNQTQNILVHTSGAISSIIGALKSHLSNAQSMDVNLVVDPIYTIYDDYESFVPSKAGLTTQAQLIAAYIRGVIEDAATNLRFTLSRFSDDAIPRKPVQAMVYANTAFWGPAFTSLRLDVIMISPFMIMISTILIMLVSLLRLRENDLKRNMFGFDPTSALDMVAACKNGDMGSFLFPRANHDVDRDSKTVNVMLYQGRDKNNGLRLSQT